MEAYELINRRKELLREWDEHINDIARIMEELTQIKAQLKRRAEYTREDEQCQQGE